MSTRKTHQCDTNAKVTMQDSTSSDQDLVEAEKDAAPDKGVSQVGELEKGPSLYTPAAYSS
eukprot:1926292-Amphidinium_carterae.1